jgi:hypothetical protein
MGTLLNRRRYMGKVNNILPSGYKQVEYIEGNTNPYIVTDYTPADTDVITIKFVFIQAPSNNQYYVLFGSRADAVATAKQNCWLGITGSRQLFVRFGTVNPSQTITLSLNTEYTIVADLTNRTVSVNGNTYSFAGSTVEPSLPIYISRLNSRSALGNGGTVRYKLLEAKRNGTQIINYIPAKSDLETGNAGGFYDTVNQQFLVSVNRDYQYIAGPYKT